MVRFFKFGFKKFLIILFICDFGWMKLGWVL